MNTLSHKIKIKITMKILHYVLFEEPKTIIILRLIKSTKIKAWKLYAMSLTPVDEYSYFTNNT